MAVSWFFLSHIARLFLETFNFKPVGPLKGCNIILCSGTRSRETLVLILLLLLHPSDVSHLIVPLKRLQLAQVSQCVIVKANSDL
jgi:hypothetical protein